MRTLQLRLLICAVLVAGLLCNSEKALATVAANTRIISNADLAYFDGSGTKHATASVTVIVALKPATPSITPGAGQAGAYPTPLVDEFTLTNNANGPDTFILTAGTNSLGNTTSVTATAGIPGPGTPITLGATVTVSGSNTTGGYTNLAVPADGNGTDNAVNGIRQNDRILINGTDERVVRSITDNGTGTSIIQVDALGSDPGTGVLIGQRVTVHATVTPNNITTPGQNVTVNVTMTAQSQTDGNFTATSVNHENTFYSGSATLTKFVRNVTNENGTGGTTITYNTYTYYNNPTTLTARPGDILEYLLVASNTSTTAAVTNVVLTDLVPVDYVTLKASTFGGKAFRYVPDASFPAVYSDFTDGSGDDATEYNATFDTTQNAAKGKITAWVGGAAPSYNTPGTIAASKTFLFLYQVTVKP